MTGDHGLTWNPWLEPLSDWLTRAGVSRYFLRWRSGRYGQHEVTTLAVVHRILPSDCLDWLAEIEPGLVPAPPAAPAEPAVMPPVATMATTASPLAADFIARLHAAQTAGELPFTVEEQDGGWQQLPYREATAWYTGQTGVSTSMLAAALLQSSPGGRDGRRPSSTFIRLSRR